MQGELRSDHPDLPIELMGVNEVGEEEGNPEITEGRDLPWLQDDAYYRVWMRWDVTFRDVKILDGEGFVTDVFNLTMYDLNDPANYEELKARLVAAAQDL